MALLVLATFLLAGERPAAATVAYGRAQAAIAEQRCDKAMAPLEEAIRVDPNYWEAHKAAADCLLSLRKAEEALPHAQRWMELRPADPGAQALVARLSAEAEKAKGRGPATATKTKAAAATPSSPPVALGDIARKRGNPKPGQPGRVYTLDSQSSGYQPPPIPDDAPVSLLGAMEKRAEEIFRPRMTNVAPAVKQLRTLRRRYLDACLGKTTTRVVTDAAEAEGTAPGPAAAAASRDQALWYQSQSQWAERYRMVVQNEEMPECRALASDIDTIIDGVAGALDGADAELARPPAVYPGVREQVFARLADELW